MSWTKVIHKCQPLGRDEIHDMKADRGSIWECNSEDCNRVWKLGDATLRNKWEEIHPTP